VLILGNFKSNETEVLNLRELRPNSAHVFILQELVLQPVGDGRNRRVRGASPRAQGRWASLRDRGSGSAGWTRGTFRKGNAWA